MKGLLIKDLCLSFQNKRNLFLYVGICFFMGFSIGGSFIIGYAAMVFGIMALSTINYDELDNGYQFLMSLPADRKTYVTEKYVFCLLMEIVGTIIGAVTYFVTSTIKGETIELQYELIFIVRILAVSFIIISFMIFIDLKYGAEKSRLALFLIYGVIAVIRLAVVKIPVLRNAFGNLLDALEKMSPAAVAAGFAAVGIIIELALYSRTVRMMEKKEF